jgi:hypothetical protein
MHTYTDSKGRTWAIQLNVEALAKVRSLLKLDLMQLQDQSPDRPGALTRLADPVILVDVLFLTSHLAPAPGPAPGSPAPGSSPAPAPESGPAISGEIPSAEAQHFLPAHQVVTAMGFACAFKGDVIDAAVNALLDELVDFFPNAAGQRTLLAAALQESRAAQKRVQKRVVPLAEGMENFNLQAKKKSPRRSDQRQPLTRQGKAMFRKRTKPGAPPGATVPGSGSESGSSPELSGSTPAPTPSAS